MMTQKIKIEMYAMKHISIYVIIWTIIATEIAVTYIPNSH